MKMGNEIKTTTTTDADGCIIAKAARGGLTCYYDGAHYDGSGSRDEPLRDAAHKAQIRAFEKTQK